MESSVANKEVNSVISLPLDACAADIGECDEGQDDNSKFKNVKD
jgi:hypothetical protein